MSENNISRQKMPAEAGANSGYLTMVNVTPRRGGGIRQRRHINRVPAAVYDGRRFLGIILPHGATAFRAIDSDERLIGVFTDRREAAIAIMRDVA
jgi:hypothetical protein